ncbi:MAG: hypothetical protein Q8T13_23780 [Acidobacteriota bacterium]|nr:hypothetical protein [Acidobacteriota bacterium]
MKAALLRWWLDLLSDYHDWRSVRHQQLADIHRRMSGYCDNRVAELDDQEARNA